MLLLINCLARAESVPHFLPHFHFSALIFAPYRVHVIGIKCTVYHTLCSQFSTIDSNFLGSSPTGHPTKKSADALHRRIFLFGGRAQWGSNKAALTRQRQSNQQPSGLLVSLRVPFPRNVYQDKCCADALHRRTFFVGGVPSGTRTATTTTAACGRNREELLGPRSDFSKPCQGAAEKSANATRKAPTARFRCGSHPLGMSTGELPAAVQNSELFIWWGVRWDSSPAPLFSAKKACAGPLENCGFPGSAHAFYSAHFLYCSQRFICCRICAISALE